MGAIDEWIANALLVHSLNLLRLSADVQGKILSLLVALSKDLSAKLAENDVTEFGRQRMNAFLREANSLISAHYDAAQSELLRNLTGIAQIEAEHTAQVLNQAFKIELGARLPPAAYLEKLASDTLIKGAASSKWWEKQAMNTQFEFARVVRLGAAQGESTGEIVARVIGKNGTPGIMDLSRANAVSLVHTSVQAVANASRLESFKKNAAVTECLVWLGTLDTHTCLLCANRDLAEYSLDDQSPIGHDLPWDGGPGAIHFGCRCVITTKSKTYAELGIDLPEKLPGTRVSADGKVAGNLNFKEWIKSKDAEWRDEYLGPGRADMYEAGKITLSDLLSQRGNKLTLEQLHAKYH